MTFEFGVAAGDVTETTAVLWTRTHPSVPVDWRVLGSKSEPPRHGATTSSADGFVHVELTDLEPGASWCYQFSVDGSVSDWGRFRTIPQSGAIRFAVVSCAKYNSGYFNAYEAIAHREDLDFVLHLGDYIYEAGQVPRGKQTPGIDIGRPFDPLHDCVTLDDYERRYAQYRRDPQLQKLHAAHGMIFTLDDHEIADNAWSGGAEEHFAEDGPWADRLSNALTAWQHWQPTRRTPAEGDALWQTVRLGDLATLFLCDTRLNRSDPFASDTTNKTILGAKQAAAFEQEALDGTEPWLVVGMASKFLGLEQARGDETADFVFQTLKLSDQHGNPHHDRWDAYADERQRLLAALDVSARRTLMLCGDVHFAAHSQTASGAVIECLTSSITSPNFDDKAGWSHGHASRPYEQKLVELIPELEWCDLDRHGYVVVELTRDTMSCEWWGVATVAESSLDEELLHRVEVGVDQRR